MRDRGAVQRREWESAVDALREAGWAAELASAAAPVQIPGRLPCGEELFATSKSA